MENTLRLLYKDRSVKFLGTIAVRSGDLTKYMNTLSVGEYGTFNYYRRCYVLLPLRFKLLMISMFLDVEFERINFF